MNYKNHPALKNLALLFLAGLFTFSQLRAQETPLSADEVLQQAYQQAAKEKKNVFLMFHASWCGWCHRMDDAMNDSICKKLFTDNYVICHLVVKETGEKKKLENPGADALLAKYHGDKSGIPFWLIFDKQGNLLADSQIRPEGAGLETAGKNVGCPAQQEEIAHFLKVLKQTSSLNKKQLAVINSRFEQIAPQSAAR